MYFRQLHFKDCRLVYSDLKINCFLLYFPHGEKGEHLSGINKCFTENPVALSNLLRDLIAVM